MHELLDELDIIECFLEPGEALIQDEVLKEQEQIYRDLGGMPLPASPQDQYLVHYIVMYRGNAGLKSISFG